tara:strand:+ start:2485 stop:3663 length:1179 start_codon:yes stop_codon:yes gene_type:complete
LKKEIIINLSIFILLLSILLFLLKILNLFISGPPRYYELVYNLESGNLKYKKEKLVNYKSKKNSIEKDDFYKYNFDNYKDFQFSGPIINAGCGGLESGVHELFFVSDKKGFRENVDNLYEKTDYVLLGDSFAMSICENRPYDLKSQLQKLNNNFTYLNLGIHNINYVKQLSVLLNITKDTEFDTLIWFFYEGNDYNDSIDKYDSYNAFQSSQAYEYENKDFNHSIPKHVDKIDYYLNKKFEITNFYKFKVWLAETVNGLSSLLKFFKKYDKLLNEDEYNEALKIAKKYLNTKNISNRYIYYIPSWQRLANHKSRKIGLYKKNPQIKQLDQLKNSVKKISEENGFIFVDGENKFINLKDPLKVFYYKLNTHFNKVGYKILAEDVYNKIIVSWK